MSLFKVLCELMFPLLNSNFLQFPVNDAHCKVGQVPTSPVLGRRTETGDRRCNDSLSRESSVLYGGASLLPPPSSVTLPLSV